VCKADNLPPSSADVTESGSLNLPEPCGPHRPVMGMLYFNLFYMLCRIAFLNWVIENFTVVTGAVFIVATFEGILWGFK
jgi:hypothetical protein